MNTTTSSPIRLLVAEDSAVCRELLVTIFQNAPGVQVVGTARDGAEAVRLVKRLKPDVVTMDVFMPEMDGYQATRQIMAESPCPIVVVSGRLGDGRLGDGRLNANENDLTFNALQAGALSVLPRPTMSENQEAFVQQVKLMAGVKVVRRKIPALSQLPPPSSVIPKPKSDYRSPITAHRLPITDFRQATNLSQINLVAIAASTGGPGALAAILSQLPADFPAPILVVQHITRGFGADLAVWLDKQTPLTVRLARHSAELKPAHVLLSPDDCHLLVNSQGVAALQKPLPGERYCPSADILFNSVAELFGGTAVGIILTGMGDDGAKGLVTLRQTGAHTIAQDEATAVIHSMPATAIQLGAAETVQPIQHISQTLMSYLRLGD
jgi:two-component system chemotaxis response regulator CheB